jgi:hypothetical protein
MRKPLLLLVTAACAAATFGCAVTDYTTFDPAAQFGVHNKSHGLIDCTTDDRIGNTQQTLELQTRQLVTQASFGAVVPCSQGKLPIGAGTLVGLEDARDWNRFIADYAFVAEVQNSGIPRGTWYTAGVKDLADGSLRLNTYFYDGLAFSCVGAHRDGRHGGPEGVLAGEMFGRLPGLALDLVAIDRGAGPQLCENVAAQSPGARSRGWAAWISYSGRSAEGRLEHTPIAAQGGLAEFFAGQPITIQVGEISMTVTGSLLGDGRIELTLLGLAAAGQTYAAVNPIRILVDGRSFRTFEIIDSQAGGEEVRVYDFLIRAGLTDRVLDFENARVAEFGFILPPVQILIPSDSLRAWIQAFQVGGEDGNPGLEG